MADGQDEMTFLDHLEELRWSLIKAIIGLVVGTIVCAYYVDWIVNVALLEPIRTTGLKIQVLTPYGIVLLYMQTALIGGFILSMPNTLYWLWQFVRPGLYPKERRYISAIVAFTSLCFFAGVAFAYFVVLPTSLQFFRSFGTQNIDLNISIDHYIGFVLSIIVGAGLVFELPMISYFLTKMGMLNPKFLRKYRRHSIVLILITAALITPTPDIITQSILAIPMFALYEISIWVSSATVRSKERSNLREESA